MNTQHLMYLQMKNGCGSKIMVYNKHNRSYDPLNITILWF